jgi:hypothetical protein
MPRRMRSASPYGLGLKTPPAPQPVNTGWRNTLNTFGQQYGQHIIPGLQSLASGALNAYNMQQLNQPSPYSTQQPMPVLPPQPQDFSDQQQEPTISPEEEDQEQSSQLNLSDLLSHLISHRVDAMGSMMPNYTDSLYSNAFNTANSQISQQGSPQYRPTGPQFAFDQTLGGGAQYSPTAALGDFSSPQAPRDWWRTPANQLGSVLGNLAPLAGRYGGLPGLVGGAALGGIGYGLQQL